MEAEAPAEVTLRSESAALPWAGNQQKAISEAIKAQNTLRCKLINIIVDRQEQSLPSLLDLVACLVKYFRNRLSQHTHIMALITSCEFIFPERNISEGKCP